MDVTARPHSVDTIVRFHDVRRLSELQRSVFSLIAQNYQPVHVHIVTQRFTAEEVAEVRRSVDPLCSLGTGSMISIHNWTGPGPKDARSYLMNYGLKHVTGRFLAFLDYDDVIYPEAYKLLTQKLIAGDAAIVFASVRVMRLQVFDSFYRVAGREKPPFAGSSLIDLFCENLAPIHSYMVDRERVDPNLINFDISLAWEEDYEFLMRLCARHRADFSMLSTFVGDYFFKSDGSNSVPTEPAAVVQRQTEYAQVRQEIEKRRGRIVISDKIQHDLGLTMHGKPMTVRDVISAFSHKRTLRG